MEGSRGNPDRAHLRQRVESLLRNVGDRHVDALFARPVLTRGVDEFSGVFTSLRGAVRFALDLRESGWPLRFRVGVGAGLIDVGARGGNAAAMDGTAFHCAAAALRRAERDGLPLAIEGDVITDFRCLAVEVSVEVHASIVAGWSKNVAETVREVRRARTQSDAARRLGKSQQIVSKQVRAARMTLLDRVSTLALAAADAAITS